MSFMMVRLMQSFSELGLDLDALPPDAHPPAHWAEDKGTRKATEQVWPKMHLTLYANVSPARSLLIKGIGTDCHF